MILTGEARSPRIYQTLQRNAQLLAQRVINEAVSADPADRIQRAYTLTLSREPQSDERERVMAFLDDLDPAIGPSAHWALVCQALIASAEFRYLE